MRQEPLPLDLVRDLLGIARALYVAWQEQGRTREELAELASIGRELRAALALASKALPGTLAHAAAWTKADRGTERLGRLISRDERAITLVAAARGRMLHHPHRRR